MQVCATLEDVVCETTKTEEEGLHLTLNKLDVNKLLSAPIPENSG